MSVVSATTITATTPAGSAGTASVLVATPSGTNIAALHAANFFPCRRQIAWPTANASTGPSAINRINPSLPSANPYANPKAPPKLAALAHPNRPRHNASPAHVTTAIACAASNCPIAVCATAYHVIGLTP